MHNLGSEKIVEIRLASMALGAAFFSADEPDKVDLHLLHKLCWFFERLATEGGAAIAADYAAPAKTGTIALLRKPADG